MHGLILPEPVLIGRRADGRPIWLAQGGAADAGGAGGTGAGTAGEPGGDPGSTAGGAGSAPGQAAPAGSAPQGIQTDDPGELKAIIARLQTEAASAGGKSRDQARAAAAADAEKALTQKIAAALGLTPDEKGDPVKLAQQVEQLTTQNTERDRELSIYRVALGPGMGVDVGRLLDSRSFMRAVSSIDPGSDTAEVDIKAKITEAVTSDPSLKARAGGAAGGSLEHSGGAGDQRNPDLSKLHGHDLLAGAYAAGPHSK